MIECQKMFDSRPKMGLFLWFMGGLFTCLLLIGTYLYHMDNKIDVHIENARHAYHQITGEEFVRPSSN